jgi:hypothetical protein
MSFIPAPISFTLKLLQRRSHCVVDVFFSKKFLSTQEIFEPGKEVEIAGTQVRRICRMAQDFPFPRLQKVDDTAMTMRRCIVVKENHTTFEQVRSLLTNSRSQLFTKDPVVVITCYGRTNWNRPVQLNPHIVVKYDV